MGGGKINPHQPKKRAIPGGVKGGETTQLSKGLGGKGRNICKKKEKREAVNVEKGGVFSKPKR